MKYINSLLFEWKLIITAFVVILSFIDLLFSIKGRKFSKGRKINKIISIVFVICGMIVVFYTNLLVKVPDLTNKTYEDAKNILVNSDLDFNTLRGCEDYIVKNQSVIGGSVVIKGTLVELSLEGYKKDETQLTQSEKIEVLREDGYRFIKTNITLYERKLQIVDEQGKVEQCLGTEIDYSNVKEVTFTNQEHGLLFNQFSIIPKYSYLSNACVVLDDAIPVGHYRFEIKVNGYDTFLSESDISAENMGVETEKGMNIYLVPKLNTQEYICRVNLVDDNFNPIYYTCYQISFDENAYFKY